MSVLCQECVKAPNLKATVLSAGAGLTRCPVCGAQATIVQCDEPIFKARFRALIRYHYAETSYNHHLGGSSISELLFAPNEITNYQAGWDVDAYEEAILEITDPPYYDYDRGISLFAGYTNGEQNLHLVALREAFDGRLHALKRACLERNHFLLDDEAKRLFSPLAHRITSELPRDTRLFRARVGFVASAIPLAGWPEERHYRPFEGAQLGAPPPPLAGVGRMNRGGVSFLYVATKADTAIAEIRPHPGHVCSVGVFMPTKNMCIADLSALDVCAFATSDKELDDFLLLKTADDVFAVPVIPEDKAEYHFTQLLADTFRHLGFDGVSYRSSVGSGMNYVFFDPSAFEYEPDSATAAKVRGLSYETGETVKMGKDDDYMTRSDGTFI